MGITGLVSSYTTLYGGVPNRIHNVQLVSHLVDNTLIAPGKEFSFNGTTGERNAAKGLLEAPVIINGELENGLGGGTCQVSTTVFNAAYEAGLPITARTNHALYISHYPQGRDATVNYPDTDLKFVNDTGHWLLLRTFVSSSSLTVNLYGTPQHRKVVSQTRAARHHRPGAAGDHEGPDPADGREGRSTTRARRRCRPASPQVYDAERQAALRQHLVLELRRRQVDRSASGRSRSRSPSRSQAKVDTTTPTPATTCRPTSSRARRRRRHDRHDHDAGRHLALRARRPPRRASRESASAAASPGRRRRAASSRRRPPRRRARARTRSGSAPRARRRSGRGRVSRSSKNTGFR